MPRKKKKSKAEPWERNTVFKQQLEDGTLPRAKTWGKKDESNRQKRRRAKKDLNEDIF